jgi:hypothetical protein
LYWYCCCQHKQQKLTAPYYWIQILLAIAFIQTLTSQVRGNETVVHGISSYDCFKNLQLGLFKGTADWIKGHRACNSILWYLFNFIVSINMILLNNEFIIW